MKKLSLSLLYQQRDQALKQLIMLNTNIIRGSLIERYKRCGKSGCHCVQGKGHGPKYYLSISFPKSRPVMIYVPLVYKKHVEEGLKNYQDAKNILEEISKINQELLIRKEVLQGENGNTN